MPACGLTCAVEACDNYYYKTREMLDGGYPVTYHYFPRIPLLRNCWITACNRTDDFKPEISFICSIHFEPEDFVIITQEDSPQQKNRILKHNAIPTRNLTLSEIKSYKSSNEWLSCHEYSGPVKIVKGLNVIEKSDESTTLDDLNGTLNTISDSEFNLQKRKYERLMENYEELKITSKRDIEKIKGEIRKKDKEYTAKLRQVLSNYLNNTEIDLVMFLRKQKLENA